MRRRVLLFLIGLAWCGTASTAEWTYTVRPGDELWNVAARYCGSASFAARIARENGLANDALIRPGMRLSIPVAWLVRQPATAEVTAVNGEVFLLEPTRRQATVGMVIDMGQRLLTGAGAAIVTFADDSTLQVSADSEVLFNVLTAYGDTGMVDTNLRFSRGRSTARIHRAVQGSSFRISTPSGTAAVRGTEFRVGVGADKTLTETLEGEVAFRQGQEIALPAGYGVVAGAAGLSREPLLEAPVWISTGGEFALGAELDWQPVPGAQAYRLLAFAASGPRNPRLESVVDMPRLRLMGLPPGPHVLSVRAISASGLEGFDASLAVQVRNPAPRPVVADEHLHGATRLAWVSTAAPYRVQVSATGSFDDAAEFSTDTPTLALPELSVGRHLWRVRDGSSVFSEPETITVRPAAVTGLRAVTDALVAEVRWSPVASADVYRVTLLGRGGDPTPLQSELVSGTDLTLHLPGYRAFRLEVVAVGNGVEGKVRSVELVPQPRVPWWSVPLAMLMLLVL